MANNKSFQRIDVFGLFEALKRDGYTKLSDHVINDDGDKRNSINN